MKNFNFRLSSIECCETCKHCMITEYLGGCTYSCENKILKRSKSKKEIYPGGVLVLKEMFVEQLTVCDLYKRRNVANK